MRIALYSLRHPWQAAAAIGATIVASVLQLLIPRLLGRAVDQMQDIFESEACDGFVIGTSSMPMGLSNFVDLIVPELQRRGLYRNDYAGPTFRENLRS